MLRGNATLQRIIDLARKTFIPKPSLVGSSSKASSMYNPHPHPADIETLRSEMDHLTVDSLGLRSIQNIERNTSMPAFFVGKPKIMCYTLHQCDLFTVAVFLFPWEGHIPLHDHPKMTVFSKLLFGKIKARAFNWLPTKYQSDVIPPDPLDNRPKHARLAQLVQNEIITPQTLTQVAYPDYANVHSFTALQPSAMFDILTPPYHDHDRPITYYKEISVNNLDDQEEELDDDDEEGEENDEEDDEDDFNENGVKLEKYWLHPDFQDDFVCEEGFLPKENHT